MRKAYSYIRMSTEQQIKGDSLRRQKKLSAEYADNHNWELIEDIEGMKLTDIGVSALHSKNAKEGALGTFLTAIKEGRVEEGSILMVENLDRLSRDRTLTAFNQFSLILDAGIEIVTLSDQRHYTRDSINTNFADLFLSLGIMFRSNEESEIKSKRLKAAWENKRKLAQQKPLTRCRPAWLDYDARNNKFKPIRERVKIIKKIFEMCISTCGLYGIAMYLNESHIPVFGRGKFWHRSYIKKIINNRAVLGEFQPMTQENNKKKTIGQPLQNYYPKIIDEDTFLRANAACKQRNVSDKGRKGKAFSNLFSGLVICGACNSKMTLRNRGVKPKGGKSLCCTNKQVKAGCTMPEWELFGFKNLLFKHLREVDFSSLINEEKSQIAASLDEKELLMEKKLTIEKKIQQIQDLYLEEKVSQASKDQFIQTANKMTSDLEDCNRQINQIELRIQQEKSITQHFDSAKIDKILDLLKNNADDFLIRSSVHQLLIKSIQKIVLHQETEKFPYEYEEQDEEIIAFRNNNKQYQNKSIDSFVEKEEFLKFSLMFRRYISIYYRTGVTRQIWCGSDQTFIFKWSFGKRPFIQFNTHKMYT